MLILAGGSSRRMGTDKAKLQVGGQTLLERALNCARATDLPIVIAGRSRPLEDVVPPSVVRCDDGPGEGPVAGLLGAASRWPQTDWLVLACDLPLLSPALLLRLRELAVRHSDAAAVVPDSGGRLHPLSAWYSPAIIECFRQAAGAGTFGLNAVLAAAPRLVPDGPSAEMEPGVAAVLRADAAQLGWRKEDLCLELLNCNRPEDLERAGTFLERRRGLSRPRA